MSNYPFFSPVLGGILRIPWSWSQTKVVNSDQVTSANLFDVLIRRKYVKEENIFFGEKKKTEKVKEENILRRKISFWEEGNILRREYLFVEEKIEKENISLLWR